MTKKTYHTAKKMYDAETQYCVLPLSNFNSILLYLQRTTRKGSTPDNSRKLELSVLVQTYAYDTGSRAVPVPVLENILYQALERAERRVVTNEAEAKVIEILQRRNYPTTTGDIIEVNRLIDLVGPAEEADGDPDPDPAA